MICAVKMQRVYDENIVGATAEKDRFFVMQLSV